MSDWKESTNKRKDFRNTKISDEPTQSVKAIKKKNTKKWCRGKVGVEHKPECRVYGEVKRTVYTFDQNNRVLVCTVCGKELDHYYSFQKVKPDWVDK